MAEGLFFIRLAFGLLLAAHGAQKLFGWFGGHGLDGTGGFFEQIGHRPGRTMAALAGVCEVTGGLLLVLGFLTPLAAAIVIGMMISAALSVHLPHGLWASNGGYELPLTYGAAATGLAFTGAGSFSVDHAIGMNLSGWGYGLGAVLVGIAAGIASNARRRKVVENTEAEAYPAEGVPDPATADRGVDA
jgi:putative oxidoreductase